VLEVIEQVNRELGTATAVITHNAPIADIADRVVTLAEGRIAAERPAGAAGEGARAALVAMPVSALDRKLLRDTARLKGQVATIAVVLAGGIISFIALRGTEQSIDRARDVYYDRQRFAHVFATLERAPESVARKIEALPGVAAIQTRVSRTGARPARPGPAADVSRAVGRSWCPLRARRCKRLARSCAPDRAHLACRGDLRRTHCGLSRAIGVASLALGMQG
jgi:hypothetical protein